MSEDTKTLRDELREGFRLLCFGRPFAADKLADLLAPLLEKPAGETLPVIDMQALTTSELAALSTVEPTADASLDEHIQHVEAALANEKTADEKTEVVAPAEPAKKPTKARKAR